LQPELEEAGAVVGVDAAQDIVVVDVFSGDAIPVRVEHAGVERRPLPVDQLFQIQVHGESEQPLHIRAARGTPGEIGKYLAGVADLKLHALAAQQHEVGLQIFGRVSLGER